MATQQEQSRLPFPEPLAPEPETKRRQASRARLFYAGVAVASI
jgi:hypothetical protein